MSCSSSSLDVRTQYRFFYQILFQDDDDTPTESFLMEFREMTSVEQKQRLQMPFAEDIKGHLILEEIFIHSSLRFLLYHIHGYVEHEGDSVVVL